MLGLLYESEVPKLLWVATQYVYRGRHETHLMKLSKPYRVLKLALKIVMEIC